MDIGMFVNRWRRWSAEGRALAPAAPISLTHLLLLAALWIAAHPYVGIEHDARYYMLQAIRANDPRRFADDFYFKYGSQDNFTLFTAAYAPVVARLGPGPAHLLFFLGEQALWFAALIWLSRLLFDRKTWLPATVAMILCDAHYGSQHIFQYGEFFVTSRPPAEALVVCALACLLRRRVVLGLACIALAGLVHPLMALAGAGVFSAMAVLHWRAWAPRFWPLVLLIGVAGAVCLALRLGSFARVFATFDSHWFDIVQQRTSYTFLAHWLLADWVALATTLGLLSFAAFGSHPHRTFFGAAALTTILALVGDFVLGDMGRSVLVVDAQLWRVTWLATLLANGYAAYLAVNAPAGSFARPIIVTALFISAMARFLFMDAMAYLIPLAIGLLVLASERPAFGVRSKWGPSFGRLIMASGLGWCLLMAGFYSAMFGFAWLIQLSVAAAGLLLVWSSSSGRLPSWARATLALVTLALAVATADIRAPWQKFMEQDKIPPDLQAFVGDQPGLYWEGDPSFVWIKLKQSTYYSCEQGTGAMFYRGTALEYEAKSKALSALNSRDFVTYGGGCYMKRDLRAAGPAGRATLSEVCKASPGLRTLVLTLPVRGAPARVWQSPVGKEMGGGVGRRVVRDYYGYSCDRLR